VILEDFEGLDCRVTYQLAGPGQVRHTAIASFITILGFKFGLVRKFGPLSHFDYEILDERTKANVAWVHDIFENYTPPPMPPADWHGWTTYADDIFPEDGRDAIAPEVLAEGEKQPWFRSLTAEGLRRYWEDAV
jgi:hypothetical protein